MLVKFQSKAFTKTVLIIFLVAVCFVFAYIKDASASHYGQLSGQIYGKPWSMKSVVLKKRMVGDTGFVVLELRNRIVPEKDLCNDDLDLQKLLVEIPLSLRNGLEILDYSNAFIRFNGDSEVNSFKGYQELDLNIRNLRTSDQAFVEGRLQVDSRKERTEISGKFQARVCN